MESNDYDILKSKLSNFFDHRSIDLEEKSIKHLKELELLKYESYIILNSDLELQGEEEEKIKIGEYENADLFLSYLDKNLNKKHLFHNVDNVEQFSICKNEEHIGNTTTNNNSTSNNKKIKSKKKFPPQCDYTSFKLNSNENHRFKKDNLNFSWKDNRSPYQINGNILNSKKFDGKKSKPVLSMSQDNYLYSESNREYKDNHEYGAFKNIQDNELFNPRIKLEVKRHNASREDNTFFNEKDSYDFSKNIINNNSQKICNNSIIHDSFYKNENYCQNIFDTEINDVNYILTEVDGKEKRVINKDSKSKKNKKSVDNFINKVRDALNFSNLIRNNHLLFSKDNSNINKKLKISNKNNYNNNFNREKKCLETSNYNSSNVNNISIYSKKENNSSGNNTKRLAHLPLMDSNIIVKDNSPIANMIKGYFNELENKENASIQNKKNISEASNMNNIINIGCANFISNNINNNFTENKNLENQKHACKNKQKQTEFQNFNMENKLNNRSKNNISLSVDKIKENYESKDTYYEYENFKSPEFGNSKARSIIKVKKPEEDSSSKEIQEHSFNVKDLNKDLEEMCIEKTSDNEQNKEHKNLKIKSTFSKISNVNFLEPVEFLESHKSLSNEKGKTDFYISQKILKKNNIEKENINNKIKKENFSIPNNNSAHFNKFYKTENVSIDSYFKKQLDLKRNICDQKDLEIKDFRSKTSKNIKKIINKKNKRINVINNIDEDCNENNNKNSILENTENNSKLEEILQNSQEEVNDEDTKSNENKITNNDNIINFEMKINCNISNKYNELYESTQNSQVNQESLNKDKISINELENKNEKNNISNNSVSDKSECNSKDNKSQLKHVEHKKNFSFGISNTEKNNVNHLANIINGNYNTENKASKNFKNTDLNEKSNLKINTFSNKKIKVISLNNKNNNSELNNKNSININNINNHKKKLSLEIKTETIDSLNDKKFEVNKVMLQTTRNSINIRNRKIDFNIFEKGNTTKNSNNKKIEFTVKNNNNKLKENDEINNSEKSQDAKKNQKFNLRNSFSKALNVNCLNTENKEKSSSKFKKNVTNIEIKENLICREDNNLDENICADSDKFGNNQEIEVAKKLTKNLSIINEKENSDKKPEATLKAFLTNNNLNKNAKKHEKITRKNFSMDLGNFNTSFQKESNVLENNHNQIKLERKNKSKKIEEPKPKKEQSAVNKNASKEEVIEITDKSNLKKDRNLFARKKEDNNSNSNNLNKENISNKNKNKRLSTKVNEDVNLLENNDNSKCKNEESLIPEEKENIKENKTNSADEIINKENKTEMRLSFEKNRSNSINNNIVLLNNLNEIRSNITNTNKTIANNKIVEPIKRRSISQDRLIQNKKNIESHISVLDKSQKSHENFDQLDNMKKRKNAFKNTSLINDQKEKIKDKNFDSKKDIQENNKEIHSKINHSRKSIINNKIKDTSITEIENDNNKKNIGNNNINIKNQKIKDNLKLEKEENKSKKNLKIEGAEKVSSSKVRKILRPKNWKNKKSETNDENIKNEDLIQETEEENKNLNPNEIQNDTEINNSESLEEEEKRIDTLSFDNMLKNIKIDDDAIYKGKQEIVFNNLPYKKNECIDADINFTTIIQEENNRTQNNEELLVETNNERKITFEVRDTNNIQINEDKDKDITKNLNNDKEISINENNIKDESQNNEIKFKDNLNLDNKNIYKIEDDINENNEANKLDNLFTPKFSPLKKNSNNFEKNINIEEGICIKTNLGKKFDEIESNHLSRSKIEEYLKNKKNLQKYFTGKKEEIFYLLFNSNFLPLEKKIFLYLHLKIIKENLNEQENINFKFSCINEKIKNNEKILFKYINDPEIGNLITEPLKPSKTAKNGLSLFSKDEENNLLNKEQPKEAINFFKFLSMLFNKEIKEEEIIENNYIKSFFKIVIPENMTLKSFAIEASNNIYLITDKNFEKIHDFIRNNPEVTKSTELLRKNRTCSYMSFLVKEIYDYYSAKASDGFYIYKLRNLYTETLKLKEALQKDTQNIKETE